MEVTFKGEGFINYEDRLDTKVSAPLHAHAHAPAHF